MTIQPKQHLGLMGSNPATGECIAVFATTPLAEEQADLIAAGTMFECKPLSEVKEAFCEVHPSRRVAECGPSVGRYRDSAIPAWIVMGDGKRYEYAGICGPVVDFANLAEGQLALAPGLIYQPTAA